MHILRSASETHPSSVREVVDVGKEVKYACDPVNDVEEVHLQGASKHTYVTLPENKRCVGECYWEKQVCMRKQSLYAQLLQLASRHRHTQSSTHIVAQQREHQRGEDVLVLDFAKNAEDAVQASHSQPAQECHKSGCARFTRGEAHCPSHDGLDGQTDG